MASGSFLDPVDRESIPGIIVRKLRNAIAYGELAPGAQLVEAELTRELGVSRGPLRQAMQRLMQEGLLVSVRNRGLFVIELSPADVRDIYAGRTAVERAAITQIMAADHADAGARLEEITQKMADADRRGNKAGVTDADLEFHELLVRLSGSPRLIRMHQTLLTETRMCVTALADTYPVPDDRVPGHSDIGAAIRSGDALSADRLLIAHMDDAVGRLLPGPR